MQHVILTESKNIEGIKTIVNREFSSFSIVPNVVGHWKGMEEKSLTIMIDGDGVDDKVERIANAIKHLNNQQSVMIQKIPTTTSYI